MWVDDEFFGPKWERWEGSDWPTDDGVPDRPAYPCILVRHRVPVKDLPAPENVRGEWLRAYLEAAKGRTSCWEYDVFADRPTVQKTAKPPVDIYDRARRASGERD